VQLAVTTSPLGVQTIDGGVCLLVLNRPAALNALNTEMARSLVATLEQLSADRGVRVMILTGAGDRAFCAGADLKERRAMSPDQWHAQHETFEQAFAALRDFPKPVFTAVNGVALGGGCEIALNTDFIIAADTARFGQPEVKLGIMPGGGGTQHLPRRIPIGLARQLLLTGETIDANTALRAGLVNSVHAPGDLVDAAVRIAAAIAANSPAAVREVRAAVRDGEPLGITDAMRVELEHYVRLVDHPDRYEGISAFNERRSPVFRDPE
jgi:enoyl-CoA hydratase/carnithine racemase